MIKNGPKEAVLETKDATIHFHKFNPLEIEKRLNWILEFWKNKRQTSLTNNQNKCEYQKDCR